MAVFQGQRAVLKDMRLLRLGCGWQALGQACCPPRPEGRCRNSDGQPDSNLTHTLLSIDQRSDQQLRWGCWATAKKKDTPKGKFARTRRFRSCLFTGYHSWTKTTFISDNGSAKSLRRSPPRTPGNKGQTRPRPRPSPAVTEHCRS